MPFRLYHQISLSCNSVKERNSLILLREQRFADILKPKLTKVAFDTRRIDQETEFNPRRNLQNYHRSQAFVSEAMMQKLSNFNKLKVVLDSLHQEYGKNPQWQDSYARVLLNSLNNGLRTFQKDGDYSDNQPSVGSLEYLEQLLHARYRLSFDDVVKMGELDLRKAILAKDQDLTYSNFSQEITKHDVATKQYDALMEKLFSVQAGCERTVTITIKDNLIKQGT